MATIKPKFKIGQMVWYIANGYVSNSTIKVVFMDKWDNIQYSTENAKYVVTQATGTHQFSGVNTKDEYSLFASKEALIKSIKGTPDDE